MRKDYFVLSQTELTSKTPQITFMEVMRFSNLTQNQFIKSQECPKPLLMQHQVCGFN